VTREQLAHVLRAASRIAGRREVIVIGSQAILGSFDDTILPSEAIGSVEADLCFFDDTDDALADQVDGAIGEASTFHGTFGYYAQGVSEGTAVLPPGWEQRLVTYTSPATEPAAGLCLDPHDLVAAKLAAGRSKDFDFVAALLQAGIVDPETASGRVVILPIGHTAMNRLVAWINAQTAD
jgi:hypothetical protein